MTEQSWQPWPRFVQASPDLLPAVRRPGPYEPWPRWGWFPREQRTWTFAPGPSLIAHDRLASPHAPEISAPGSPPGDAPAEAATGASDEPIVARPVRPGFMQGFSEHFREGPAPVESSSTTALVPVRRELVLADVTRAARRVAPVAAVAGVVAVAALALFRRR